jgi:hypothetical protein
MKRHLRCFTVFSALLGAIFGAEPGLAQKPGGILRVYHWDSPASMSIHEEATYSTVVPMMGVFNNLIMYKQDEWLRRPLRGHSVHGRTEISKLVCSSGGLQNGAERLGTGKLPSGPEGRDGKAARHLPAVVLRIGVGRRWRDVSLEESSKLRS